MCSSDLLLHVCCDSYQVVFRHITRPMKTTASLLILVALSVPGALEGQQAETPNSAQAAPTVQPCSPQPSGLGKNVHPENIKPLNKGLNKLGGILNKTTGGAITAPTAGDISKATKPAPAPCPAPAVPPPAPAKPAPKTQEARPAFVCPPKSTLIPNHPYCIYPDNSVVDAIPLPANLPTATQH